MWRWCQGGEWTIGLGCFECIEPVVPLLGRQAAPADSSKAGFRLTSPRAKLVPRSLKPSTRHPETFNKRVEPNGMLDSDTSTASALA